jgi:hypothetical protein
MRHSPLDNAAAPQLAICFGAGPAHRPFSSELFGTFSILATNKQNVITIGSGNNETRKEFTHKMSPTTSRRRATPHGILLKEIKAQKLLAILVFVLNESRTLGDVVRR